MDTRNGTEHVDTIDGTWIGTAITVVVFGTYVVYTVLVLGFVLTLLLGFVIALV